MRSTQESCQIAGTADKDCNIIWFTETYIADAERAGDDELAELFRLAQDASRRGGEEGKRLLASRVNARS
jgi:hypothetical protein